MSLQRLMELSAAAYLTSRTGLVFHTTEDADLVSDPQNAFASCPESRGATGLPGCEDTKLKVELHTVLALHPSRAAATADHYAKWATIREAVMQDDLASSLATATSGFGINGIVDSEIEYGHENRNGTLVNSATITISAVSKSLTA